jgi:hypothetical protein
VEHLDVHQIYTCFYYGESWQTCVRVCGTTIDFDMIQSAQTCIIQYVAAAFRNRLVRGSEAKTKARSVVMFRFSKWYWGDDCCVHELIDGLSLSPQLICKEELFGTVVAQS